MTLASTARRMASIRPPEPVRWNHLARVLHKTLEGSLPPVPRACRGVDPNEAWPEVEANLGRGVGQRRALFLVTPTSGQMRKWTPPDWWTIESVQEGSRVFDPDREGYGDEWGDWVFQPIKPRPDGAYRLREGWVLRFEVRIDGPPAGLDEGAEFYRWHARRR